MYLYGITFFEFMQGVVLIFPYCCCYSIYIVGVGGYNISMFSVGERAMKKKINYSWVIVVICFLSVCTGLGFCSGGRTMYLTAVTDALHIKRSAFSLTETLRFCATTVINLFFGFLIGKFGTKKLLCAGFSCLIAFGLISAYAETLFGFYFAAILLGVGLSWTGTTMMGTIVNIWCDKNQGTVTGAILCANGLGSAVAVQILTPIIFEEGNPFGYRTSYLLVALIMAVMLVLILLFFRERPKNEGKKEIVIGKKKKIRGVGWTGIDYKDAIKKPYFYLTLLCMAFTGMALQGLAGIATPHMYDLGLDKGFVATVMTVSSLVLMGSKFFLGILCDRKGVRLVTNICLACSFLSLLGVMMISDTALGRGIAMFRVLFHGLSMPLETVMLPLLTGELFGNKSFAKLLGLCSAASCVGFAIGAPFANFFYDLLGNYNLAFVIFACLMVFVTVTLQFVFRSAARDRKIIESENHILEIETQ